MTDAVIHPGLVLIVGALAPAIAARPPCAPQRSWRCRSWPCTGLAGAGWRDGRCASSSYTITPLQGDKLSRLFATIFALMAAGGGLFAARPEEPRSNYRRPSSMPGPRSAWHSPAT